ncbi:MAG TPA: FAD-binding oxidoreductase [Humisphaera sp.]
MSHRTSNLKLAGWGNLNPTDNRVYRPERTADVRAVVRHAATADPAGPGDLIARGLGRSYGDCAVNGQGGRVALMTRMDRLVAFDPDAGVVEAEAGVAIADLLDLFLPRGFFPPITPGTTFVTLGGAVAADVHGKNHHADGTISNFVERLDLLTADGTVVPCSPSENAELFWATVGGMGLTGIILTVRLRMLRVPSAYLRVRYRRAANLDAAMEMFDAESPAGRRYSVAWVDGLATGPALGRSVLMEGDHLPAADLPPKLRAEPLARPRRRVRSVPFNLPRFALPPLAVRLFNAAYYRRHGDAERTVPVDPFFYPLDAVHHWNRIYGRRGFVQYQALFPPGSARRGLVELLEQISGAGAASFLAVLKRTGPAGKGMLSFPFPGYTLALDLPNKGGATAELTAALDAVLLKHGGRLYLAKDATTTPEAFARMYPRLDEFRAVKARVDPHNRFSSTQARRLKIVG